MLLVNALVIGGATYVSTKVVQKKQKNGGPFSGFRAKATTKGNRTPLVQSLEQNHLPLPNSPKEKVSFYAKLQGVGAILKLDEIVPRTKQIQQPLFIATLSPWHGSAPNAADKTKSSKAGQSLANDWRLLVRYVRKYSRPYRVIGGVSVVCLLSFGLYQTYFAYMISILIDTSLAGNGLAVLLPMFSKLLIITPFIVLAAAIGTMLNSRVGARMIQDIHYDLYDHLQGLSLDFYKQSKLGNILAHFGSDTDYVRLGIAEQLLPTIADLLVLGINALFLMWLNWQLALISLVSVPLSLYVMRQFSPHVARANYGLADQHALMMNAVQEGVRAQSIIKSYNVDGFFKDSFLVELLKLEGPITEATYSREIYEQMNFISLFFSKVVATSAALVFLAGGAITVGTLTTFILMQGIMHQNMRYLFRNRMHQLISAGVGFKRVDSLFQNRAKILDAPDAIELSDIRSVIQFQNVSFSYDGIKNQLDQINFTIDMGQFVAFVGPSGAGKSTLLSLIMRFYDVTAGQVLVDGYDVREVSQTSLRAQAGIVLQETFIFNSTILHNIRISRPYASDEEVVAAAKAAELHDFIMSLPDGYQSNVGAAGGRLSGGQKQRIAIARALLCNPSLLILDEATTSLDADTAAAIDATIQKLAKDRTIIAISHHLSSVMNADTIFVMDKGHIIEQGTHEMLLRQSGLYAQLWKTQNGSSNHLVDSQTTEQLKESTVIQNGTQGASRQIAMNQA
ncbi:MAG: ABC transporter ATP-binding protein [Caldilineaceae bacterium]